MKTSLLAQGNSLTIPLTSGSVHCIVTSPPYWGLRSYQGTGTWAGGDPACNHCIREDPHTESSGLDGGRLTTGHQQEQYTGVCRRCGATRIDHQLGSEPLHDCLGWAKGENCGVCYVCHMRLVFAELWRALRDDGVCWLNLGDSYNGSGGAGGDYAKGGLKDGQPKFAGRNISSLKPKDMCGIPWRVALALQADGWYLRSEIIWHKPAPMPESVTDRPTKAHEQIFLLTKNARYFYDQEAVKEDSNDARAGTIQPRWNDKVVDDVGAKDHATRIGLMREREYSPSRNLRTVWTLPPSGFSGAHFATFPPSLPERCIKAGTSEAGCCSKCGKMWERVVEVTGKNFANEDRIKEMEALGVPRQRANLYGNPEFRRNRKSETLGFRPTCQCSAPAVPALVFDPFNGAGTTGLVAQQLGRRYIGLDLSMEYLRMSQERLGHTALEAWVNGKPAAPAVDDLPLFGGPHE